MLCQKQDGTGSQWLLEVTPRSSKQHIFPFLWSRGSLLCLFFIKLWNELLAVGILLMPAVLRRIWLSSVFRIILLQCPYKHEHTAQLENNSFPLKFLEKFCFFSGNICFFHLHSLHCLRKPHSVPGSVTHQKHVGINKASRQPACHFVTMDRRNTKRELV